MAYREVGMWLIERWGCRELGMWLVGGSTIRNGRQANFVSQRKEMKILEQRLSLCRR